MKDETNYWEVAYKGVMIGLKDTLKFVDGNIDKALQRAGEEGVTEKLYVLMATRGVVQKTLDSMEKELPNLE
jgi:hypothetical protein